MRIEMTLGEAEAVRLVLRRYLRIIRVFRTEWSRADVIGNVVLQLTKGIARTRERVQKRGD